ncbi:MAG: alpha/beta hydrolase [Chloroflexi bacterium]|nr:alpha/beta hydrolase [Chloroflexota bacterium]
MKKWQKLLLFTVVVSFVGALIIILYASDLQAHELVTNPPEERRPIYRSPASFGLEFEDITLTTVDGFDLVGWYIPSRNGAAVIAQHGYKGNREEMLEEADMLARHGYGVIMVDMRAHGGSEGEVISFGVMELQDMEAIYQYLLTRPEVDPERIGILGNSNGAAISILYTAQNQQIKALITVSSYASLQDEIAIGIEALTILPAFPFAPLIQYFAEQEVGFQAEDISAIAVIDQIAPRPIFILQGGADTAIPTDSGQRLYDTANEPKELWFEPDLGHISFDVEMPEEFEARIIAFFDMYLLGD